MLCLIAAVHPVIRFQLHLYVFVKFGCLRVLGRRCDFATSITNYHGEGPPIFDRNQDQFFHLKQMKQIVEEIEISVVLARVRMGTVENGCAVNTFGGGTAMGK
jgi:hypothetical protein